MKRKPPEAVFRRIAREEGIGYKQAIRVAAARGGRRSARGRRKAGGDGQQPLL